MASTQQLVSRIAARQSGCITAQNLHDLGLSHGFAYRRVKSGEWVRTSRGVYRVAAGGVEPSCEQRMLVASLAVPHGIIIGWFAASFHGLPVPPHMLNQPVVLGVGNGKRSRVVQVRRCSGPMPSQPLQYGRVARVTLTIVTLAALGVTKVQLETALDTALSRRLVTVKAIRELINKTGWLRFAGRTHLLHLLDERSDGKALFRSKTEARVKQWIKTAGVRAPLTNFDVATPIGDVEVDMAWPEYKVCLEVSPFWTHGSRKKQERDLDRRQALRTAGWRIAEADDRHLENNRTFAPVVAVLAAMLA